MGREDSRFKEPAKQHSNLESVKMARSRLKSLLRKLMNHSLNRMMLATTLIIVVACTHGAKSMIIDVRTIEEWNAGHLSSAQHLQLELVASNIDNLVADKDQPVYLYCQSGNRSGQAKIIMEGLGYTQVINAGGIGDARELLTEEIVR